MSAIEAISELKAMVNALNSIDRIGHYYDDMWEEIENIENAMDAKDAEIARLQARVKELEADVETLKYQM